MAPRKKRLIDFVRDRSFLARRHEALLDSSPLLDNPILRWVQERYQAEVDPAERRRVALEFERLLRKHPEWELAELHRIFDAMPVELVDLTLRSDISGARIPDGTGATVRVIYEDREKGAWELMVTDEEAATLTKNAWRLARSGESSD